MMQNSGPAFSRQIDDRELCHERLGDRFETGLSDYDTQRRLEILCDEFLGRFDLSGKRALDVGCGLGYFSRRLKERGADVTSVDLGEKLVERTVTLAGSRGVVADALALDEKFAAGSFDVVISSECIEHTPDPAKAVTQMCRLLAPGGVLALSTPNLLWLPAVKLATVLKVRPFDGFENFSTWSGLERTLETSGLRILERRGLHLFPFQIPLRRLSRWCDARLQPFRKLMINICLLAQVGDETR